MTRPGSSPRDGNGGPDGPSLGLKRTLRQVVDATVYGLAVAGVVVAVGVGIRLVGGAVGDVVFLTFVAGIVTLAYATYQLLPGKPWRVEHTDAGAEIVRPDRSRTVGTREETRFQAAVQRLPPLNRYGLAPEHRYSPATKLFVAGVTLLAASLGIEAAFVW